MVSKLKILTVIGTRPQFIKAAALSYAIIAFNNKYSKNRHITETIVDTGQHYDACMSTVFIQKLGLPAPKYNLNINKLSHISMTAKMMLKIEQILKKEMPDYIIIFGDTNSTLSAALAASKTDIRIVHIEAGLRSNNLKMPEEVNRILSDRISDLLFCSSNTGYQNLITKEGFPHNTKFGIPQSVQLVGDVMIDSIELFQKYSDLVQLGSLNIKDKPFILTTMHREQVTNKVKNLRSVVSALTKLSNKFQVIFPAHPKIRKFIQNNSIALPECFIMLEPQPYFEMQCLIKKADFVITDSGGIQKEAFYLGTPCITTREETEWPETISNGMNVLTGYDEAKILKAIKNYSMPDHYDKFAFGDAKASERIVESIFQHHSLTRSI